MATDDDDEYHDFTTATNWERFAADVEHTLRVWLEAGPTKVPGATLHVVRGGGCCAALRCCEVNVPHTLSVRTHPYKVLCYSPLYSSEQSNEGKPTVHGGGGGSSGSGGGGGSSSSSSSQVVVASDGDSAIQCLAPRSSSSSSRPAVRRAEEELLLPWWACRAGGFLRDAPHKLQQWFGVDTFAVVAPASYSGRILHRKESTLVLSAAAVALQALATTTTPSSPLSPAGQQQQQALAVFVPVGDGFHDAYDGVALVGGRTLRLETNSVRSASPPSHLMHARGQVAALAAQAAPYSASAALALRRLLGDMDIASQAAALRGAGSGPSVCAAARRCFEVPGVVAEPPGAEWDERCPWREWMLLRDPVGALVVDVLWEFPTPCTAGDSDRLDVTAAQSWQLQALSAKFLEDNEFRLLTVKAKEHVRPLLLLPQLPQEADKGSGGDGDVISGGGTLDELLLLLPGQEWGGGAAAEAFVILAQAVEHAAGTTSMGDLATAEWWERRGLPPPAVPSEASLARVLEDLFDAHHTSHLAGVGFGSSSSGGGGGEGVRGGTTWEADAGGPQLPHGAPHDSFISRLAMHSLLFGNARAVAVLWQAVLRMVRMHYWEAGRQLPRMCCTLPGSQAGSSTSLPPRGGGLPSTPPPLPPPPTWGSSLLHQKLQMLDYCISRMGVQAPDAGGAGPSSGRHHAGGSRARAANGNAQRHSGARGAAAAAEVGGSQNAASSASAGSSDGEWTEFTPRTDFADPREVEGEGDRGGAGGGSGPGSTTSSAAGRGGSASPAPSFRSCASSSGEEEVDEGLRQEERGRGEGGALSPNGKGNGGGNGDPLPTTASSSSSSLLRRQSASLDPGLFLRLGDGMGGAAEGGVPQGVQRTLSGVTLIHHPDRTVNIPITQATALAEDQVMERCRMVAACSGDRQLHNVVHGKMQAQLVSDDMRAFKAANPGCCLEDFLRWRGPEAYRVGLHTGQPLSPISRLDQIASWQCVWDAAAPLPAAQQQADRRHLEREGEAVLHGLETMAPLAVMQQLMALAAGCCTTLLADSDGARLPAARQAVVRFVDRASTTAAALATCALPFAALDPTVHGGDAIPRRVAPRDVLRMVWQLAAMEATVTAGESLLRRLPCHSGLAARLLASCCCCCEEEELYGEGGGRAAATERGATRGLSGFPVGSAMASSQRANGGQHGGGSRAPGPRPKQRPGLEVRDDGDRVYIDAIMNLEVLHEHEWRRGITAEPSLASPSPSASSSPSAAAAAAAEWGPNSGGGRRAKLRGGWRSRHNSSWVLQCGGAGQGGAGVQPVHRLCVHCVDDETRVVLVLVAE